MTPAEQIAADVAARYGVAVCASVVRFIPRGMQSIRFDDVTSWKQQRVTEWDNRQRVKSAREPKHGPAKLDGESDSAYLARALQAKASLAQIGVVLGISAPAVLKRARKVGHSTMRAAA